MNWQARSSCLLLLDSCGSLHLGTTCVTMSCLWRVCGVNAFVFAVVGEEHFEHVDHASALTVGCRFEGELEGWRHAKV